MADITKLNTTDRLIDSVDVINTNFENLNTGKPDKATTLSGYGITDAKIDSGVITLGSNSITPVQTSNIANNLTTTAAGYVLDARQGKALSDGKVDKTTYATDMADKVSITQDSNIAWHNTYPRCKYLGTAITDAQNTAIKNRTYNDLYIGDYWTIGGVNYRIVALDYYYRCGDTDFAKGNVIVVPDTCLYNAQMNSTSITTGGYAGSAMRSTNLASAKSTASSAFGSHVASHRILMTNATDSNGPSGWAWMDSAGVELMNETQVYGTRTWSSALKAFDNGTQKQQFPLFAVAPQFINIRNNYWLQDISSGSVSAFFAHVNANGYAGGDDASASFGVRPAITLSYV